MSINEINKELKIIANDVFQKENEMALDLLDEELVLEELSASSRFYGPDYED